MFVKLGFIHKDFDEKHYWEKSLKGYSNWFCVTS